ncbi:MAG: tryptophan--tRNA ligase [Nitrospira bacterium SM23_35]|nr:MAG: tryptophan--tRNA ligase [Nitrospira bacterium SM23_35]
MQSSGRLHLGNLIGALSNWVRLQDTYDCYYFIADWHSLTTGYADPSEIKNSTTDLMINFLAAGLDPDKCTLSTYGFLGYPLLQTADIIIYRAKYVPVGIDQVPHLEISREIARRFNFIYREIFPEPEALLTDFPKVVGTDGRKMSKSYDNAIYLSDSPGEVEQKIRTMITDPARVKKTDPGNPELSPVYQLHKVFSSKEEQEQVAIGCRTAGIGCIECKKILIRNVFKVMEPIWERRNKLIQNPEILHDVLEKGTEKARKVTEDTMRLVREAMGLY